MCINIVGISAEPLGHGHKVEVTKLPRFKKELRLAVCLLLIAVRRCIYHMVDMHNSVVDIIL